jgi:hypothetical protein
MHGWRETTAKKKSSEQGRERAGEQSSDRPIGYDGGEHPGKA